MTDVSHALEKPVSAEIVDDHRVKIGRMKRDRTQQRLFEAILTETGARRGPGPPPVEDILRAAGVSRATFYKHFTSIDQAMAVLGRHLENEMILSYQAMFDDSETAFFRLTTANQLFLFRAVIDPLWASFVSRAGLVERELQNPRVGVTMHLLNARRDGDLDFTDADAAASIAFGSIIDAAGRISRVEECSRSYVEEVAAMILRAWGVQPAAALAAVADRTAFIRRMAPGRLHWWKDPWNA